MAARRWHQNRTAEPLLRATAAGLSTLCNLQGGKQLKQPISPLDLAPALLSPAERAARLARIQRVQMLEREAKAGRINPDKIEDGPVLLTASMIGGRRAK